MCACKAGDACGSARQQRHWRRCPPTCCNRDVPPLRGCTDFCKHGEGGYKEHKRLHAARGKGRAARQAAPAAGMCLTAASKSDDARKIGAKALKARTNHHHWHRSVLCCALLEAAGPPSPRCPVQAAARVTVAAEQQESVKYKSGSIQLGSGSASRRVGNSSSQGWFNGAGQARRPSRTSQKQVLSFRRQRSAQQLQPLDHASVGAGANCSRAVWPTGPQRLHRAAQLFDTSPGDAVLKAGRPWRPARPATGRCLCGGACTMLHCTGQRPAARAARRARPPVPPPRAAPPVSSEPPASSGGP